MSVYFFNIYNDEITPDHEGADLADEAAARIYAVRAARALAADSVLQGHLDLRHRIEIENEAHELVDIVRYGDVVAVRQ